MANIREYRASNPASGPRMYRDALNQLVVDDSIRLEAGASANDAIELQRVHRGNCVGGYK